MAAAWELTVEQAAVFDGFHHWRGRDGAQWFELPVHGGIGFVATDCRFAGDLDWSPRAGGGWQVAAPLELRERAILTAAELALLQGEDWAALFAVVLELRHAIDGLEGEG